MLKYIFFLLLFFLTKVEAQQIIELNNPSFEDFPMKGKKYKMSIYLAKALYYNSKSATTGKDDNYTEPVILKIWGRNSKTKKKELLAKSSPIEKEYWDVFVPVFSPKADDFDIIIFEAYFRDGTREPYNGNLLIDNLSDIKEVVASKG